MMLNIRYKNNIKIIVFEHQRYKTILKRCFLIFLSICCKMLRNRFCRFWPLLNIIWYFWPWNVKFHIQKINFASTRHSGSPFLPQTHFSICSQKSEKPLIPKSMSMNGSLASIRALYVSGGLILNMIADAALIWL